MSKSDAMENGQLELFFKNTAFANVGDAGGLPQSVAPGSLHFSLHTADPGEAGTQLTNEIAYTSYARVAVARSGAGFTVTANQVFPAAVVTFPAGTGGSGTATHFGVGTAASGAGILLYSGTLSPTIVCGSGVTPQLSTATSITEE